jgi:hypothetical protein
LESEKASADRRQITWSQGDRDLRKLAGLRLHQTDEEIAAADLHGDEVLALPGETWRVVRRSSLAADLLDAAEREGPDGAIRGLDSRKLIYFKASPGLGQSDRPGAPPRWSTVPPVHSYFVSRHTDNAIEHVMQARHNGKLTAAEDTAIAQVYATLALAAAVESTKPEDTTAEVG